MNYQETLDYMFNALPMYQKQGKSAFKKDLSNTLALCKHLGNPQDSFKSIHVAGTNGKGSSAHMIAAMLQNAGFKVGLYTSPHLKDFRERIRISGKMISENEVIDFIQDNKDFIQELEPSFFEMTVALAFDAFARQQVDIAVIEVGLGGRLDSTNVITPEICLITNIGLDHMDMLGDTIPKIAVEKAGIIKEGVPVVIGQYQDETALVFESIAQERNAQLLYADDIISIEDMNLPTDLKGDYQLKNKVAAIATVTTLLNLPEWEFNLELAKEGLARVSDLTGLKGRWQVFDSSPLTICDTGHNKEAFEYILPSLEGLINAQLWMVLGFVNDKNVADLLKQLPKDAEYVFTQAKIPRAMPLTELKRLVTESGLRNVHYVADVNDAIELARTKSGKDDLIFIGGSTFVVAEIEGL